MTLGPLFSMLGLGILAYRLAPVSFASKPRSEMAVSDTDSFTAGLVSIIIPARNEAQNLPIILASLTQLQYRDYEVIVVDDASTDDTLSIAQMTASNDPHVRVLEAGEKPEGWVGKTWACQQGAAVANGEWLLFTDADTEHMRSGLTRVMKRMSREKIDLLSAIPYHLEETFFDALMGPFHLMVLISSSAFSKPSPKRIFGIGQYLLFKREYYIRQGGHEVVKGSFAEDQDFAVRCLALQGNYGLDRTGEVFGVRMYASASEFLAGWRRIFRQGFPRASLAVAIEVFFILACLTMSFHFAAAGVFEITMALIGLTFLGFAQKTYGQFSLVGLLTAPLSLGVFIVITALALFDLATGRDLRWRGRSYIIKK